MIAPQTLRYGPHELQELLVWIPEQGQPSDSSKVSLFWIILIHGGAWRDPTITHLTFAEPTVSILLSSSYSSSPSSVPSLLNNQQDQQNQGEHQDVQQDQTQHQHQHQHHHRQLAIASISYRLSSHPSHPQDPTTTPPTSLRNARHPDHLDDIGSALAILHAKHGLTQDNYILVGHSCGATLAFQTLQRQYQRQHQHLHHSSQIPPQTASAHSLILPPLPSPRAIVGLAGIYDLQLLLKSHKDGPYGDIYASFLQGAFGQDMDCWDRASPACFSEKERDMFAGRTILLATAGGDELVEPEQREVMRRAILGSEVSQGREHQTLTVGADQVLDRNGCRYVEMQVQGGHDEMWLVGERMVAVIEKAVRIMGTGEVP